MLPHLFQQIKQAGKTIAESGDRMAAIRTVLDSGQVLEREDVLALAKELLEDKEFLKREEALQKQHSAAPNKNIYGLDEYGAWQDYIADKANAKGIAEEDYRVLRDALEKTMPKPQVAKEKAPKTGQQP